MAQVTVRTQAELDAALVRGDYPKCVGEASFVLSGNARATLRDNASAELWGNARANLWGHSLVRVRSPHVHVQASKQAIVILHCDAQDITGGVIVRQPNPTTAEDRMEAK